MSGFPASHGPTSVIRSRDIAFQAGVGGGCREFVSAIGNAPVIKAITTFTDAPLHIIEGPELSFSGSYAPAGERE